MRWVSTAGLAMVMCVAGAEVAAAQGDSMAKDTGGDTRALHPDSDFSAEKGPDVYVVLAPGETKGSTGLAHGCGAVGVRRRDDA